MFEQSFSKTCKLTFINIFYLQSELVMLLTKSKIFFLRFKEGKRHEFKLDLLKLKKDKLEKVIPYASIASNHFSATKNENILEY